MLSKVDLPAGCVMSLGFDSEKGIDRLSAYIEEKVLANSHACGASVPILDMFIDLLIGVPEPDEVDQKRVAAALPYGTVSLTVTKGGLEIPADDGKDAIVIANAGIVVRLAD